MKRPIVHFDYMMASPGWRQMFVSLSKGDDSVYNARINSLTNVSANGTYMTMAARKYLESVFGTRKNVCFNRFTFKLPYKT